MSWVDGDAVHCEYASDFSNNRGAGRFDAVVLHDGTNVVGGDVSKVNGGVEGGGNNAKVDPFGLNSLGNSCIEGNGRQDENGID